MPSPLPVIIRRKLDRLRWSLRFYAALDGYALLFLTVSLLFLLDVALDRFFEFPVIVRIILLPVLSGVIFDVFWQRVYRRCSAFIRRDQLATALEHFVPNLNESLITAVEGAGNKEFDPELMRQTMNEAAAALRGVNVRRFLRTGRVILRFVFSCFCAAAVIVGCMAHPEIVSIWYSRNILLSQQEYPRRSELLVDGFQEGRARIGRGNSFTLSIRANMDKPVVPETLRVRIGTKETGYRTLLIDQFRRETREGTQWRVFSVTFPEMLETVHLQIRGADSTINDLCIEVVPTPTLTGMMLTQQFPDYIGRPQRTVPLSGRTMIPDGTDVTITATSTKPLLTATAILETADDRRQAAAESGDVAGTSGHVDNITLTLPALREEMAIDFRLRDMDSLTNRHPIRVELGIIKDQPPVVTARLSGIGSAITPEAVLPIVGEITDDNGLAWAVSRYQSQSAATSTPPSTATPGDEQTDVPQRQSAEGTVPIAGITSGQTVFPLEQTFAVSPLAVLPGDKLVLCVEASDLYNLDSPEGQPGGQPGGQPSGQPGGQLATGPRWLLEIVTPETLKTMLETREIALRQRFEVVIGEVERTQNMLSDYSLEPTEQQVQQAEALTLESKEEEEPNEEERQREWETQKQNILNTITAEQADLGKYHLSRMLRDTQKEVYDLTGIVGAFREIRQEMINNRIFSEDERKRIDQEIIQPIQELIDVDFPDIDQWLGALSQLLSAHGEPTRPSAQDMRQNILKRFEATLQKMTAIRDKMASMESFNEAIELLRSIIKQQQQLRNETMEERNKRLRDLLD